jgi:hypothetical protein
LGIEPNPFLPKKSARLILPDVRDEHSLVYTPETAHCLKRWAVVL